MGKPVSHLCKWLQGLLGETVAKSGLKERFPDSFLTQHSDCLSQYTGMIEILGQNKDLIIAVTVKLAFLCASF